MGRIHWDEACTFYDKLCSVCKRKFDVVVDCQVYLATLGKRL
jgi:hypothetical protein